MFKKISCHILSVIMLLLAFLPAIPLNVNASTRLSVEEILDDFYQKCFEAQKGKSITHGNNSNQQLEAIRQDTIDTLANAGYNVFDVNPNTYNSVESLLQMNLSEIGIDPNCSYIVVVSGEDSDASASSVSPQTYGTVGSSFTYTYNGYTHTMRYVTVAASDVPSYAKASSVNLIKGTTSVTTLQNILNSSVSLLLDSISSGIPLGTIAGICGVEYIQINPAKSTTLTMFANASWARVYTQIYNANTGMWLSWSSVDYVTTQTHMGGDYYDKTTNQFKQFPQDKVTKLVYSEHYGDLTWRKSQAAAGWQYGSARNEYVGDVAVYHNGKQVIYIPQSIAAAP